MARVDPESIAEARTGVRLRTVAREVVRQAVRDDVIGLSAELAYRFFIALFPFFIAVTAIGGIVGTAFGMENPARTAVAFIGDILPREGSQFLEDQLRQVIDNASRGQLVASALLAIVVATSGTNSIIKGLNRAYGVDERRPYWRRYLTALLITIGAGTVALLAIILLLPFRALLQPSLATTVLAALIAVALLTVAGTFLFRIGPSIKLPVRVVLPGAALFAAISAVAAIGFGIYVSEFADYASTYGVLAGVVLALVWFYVMGLALMISAETNQVVHAMSDPNDMAYRREQAAQEGRDDFHPGDELRSRMGTDD